MAVAGKRAGTRRQDMSRVRGRQQELKKSGDRAGMAVARLMEGGCGPSAAVGGPL